MKRSLFSIVLFLIIFAFPYCKKESNEGGIRVSFTANKPYQYISLSLSVSYRQYGDPIAQITTGNVKEVVQITGLPPGNYHWNSRVTYTSTSVSGSYSFYGDIIIEKGKMMHITLED